MNRIEAAFGNHSKKAAFMPFVTAGLPRPELFTRTLEILERGGADIIEVGLPFSDPIADGPVIQAASAHALGLGVSVSRTFELIGEATAIVNCPIVLMTYVNPLMRMGFDTFAMRAREAGISAVIVPDLPIEEARVLKEAVGQKGIGTVFLTTPVTQDDRVRKIADASDGFVYYVNLKGVTGAGIDDATAVEKGIARVKELTGKPVAAGFGVNSPQLAARLAGAADGVIVGSHFVKLVMSTEDESNALDVLETEVRAFSKALEK